MKEDKSNSQTGKPNRSTLRTGLCILGWLLLSASEMQVYSQLKGPWPKERDYYDKKVALVHRRLKDSWSRYETFFSSTNDYMYIRGKKYEMKPSPLFVFPQYERIYDTTEKPAHTAADKDYAICWALGPDSMIYLCQAGIREDDQWELTERMDVRTYVDLSTFLRLPGELLLLYHLNPSEYMRHLPIERLTGLKFRPSPYFPRIVNMPLNENGVLPAVWYSDTLYVKKALITPIDPDESYTEYEYRAPFQQLIVENGKVVQMNEIVPWTLHDSRIISPWVMRYSLND